MDITYPELWLLELGCKSDASWLPVVWLDDTQRVQESGYNEQWNCPPNGLTVRGMARLLVDMQNRGLIEIWQVVNDEPSGVVVPKDCGELHAWLIDERRRLRGMIPWISRVPFHCVRVTAAGIARWEKYAHPDWSRYRGDFEGRLEAPGETVWTQSAMTEAFAREVLEVYGDDVFFPSTMHWETLQTTVHEPWDVFPGKRLPRGVTLTVNVTEYGPRSISCDDCELNAKNQDQYRRFCNICDWYERGVRNHPDRPLPTKRH